MDYIDNLEVTVDSHEFKIESMKDQIQLMYEYIGHLENAEKELACMLAKYHDDDCHVCDRAYKAQDIAQFKRGVFNGLAMAGMEKNNWVTQDMKTK